jgi:hypothetical protein
MNGVGYPVIVAAILGLASWMTGVSVVSWKAVTLLKSIKESVEAVATAATQHAKDLAEHREEDAKNFATITTRLESYIEFQEKVAEDRIRLTRKQG